MDWRHRSSADAGQAIAAIKAAIPDLAAVTATKTVAAKRS